MNSTSISALSQSGDSLLKERLILDSKAVHVWHARLDQCAEHSSRILSLLSADECERAERFRFRRDRDHFIVARGLLRIVLGRYLDLPPAQLSFTYSPYGKPALAAESDRGALRFNVSHSHEVALYAVTLGREIGIDVEYIRPDVINESIAEHFFSKQEVATLRALPVEVQPQAFFNCWTRKEAFIKARGEGLSFPLDQFDVSLAPEEPTALLRVRNDLLEASRWSLQALPVEEDYVAALAVEGHDWRLECRTLRSITLP